VLTWDMNEVVGSHDLLWVTLDTLRHDVACAALAAGRTPNLARLLPGGAWERRQSPGSFTYAAHHAFFAGFLPTPDSPGPHPRLFAASFAGSETTTPRTFVFEEADLPRALSCRGYRTVCIGGVGFFNRQTPLARVLPDLFDESHWSPELGVTDPRSTANQVALAESIIAGLPADRRLFLFINVSALHQPNRIFSPGAAADSVETMADALAHVDRHLGRLIEVMRARAPLFCLLMSDHGTAYGEDGRRGHRQAHPVVWTVPYAELRLDRVGAAEAAR
jgi:hypothetical protein